MTTQAAQNVSHTLGPWRCGTTQGLNDDVVYGLDGHPVVCTETEHDHYSRETQLANARLIAAAPELLEALKTTAGNIRSLGPAGALGPYSVWLEVVEAVIAKAEGR